jgi:subtilisin family serine protease
MSEPAVHNKCSRHGCSLFIWLGVLLACLPVATVFAEPPNDPYYHSSGAWGQDAPDLWGLRHIGFTSPSSGESAWSLETGQTNPVIVAVIDSGIDYYHPDINPNTIWRNAAETPNGIDDDNDGYVDDLIGWNFVSDNNNPWDDAGHGTLVSGIIAAASDNGIGITGINWGARIMPLKVLNFSGAGRSSGIAEAIFYAVKHGARVINLSLGGQQISETERLAVDYAYKQGVLVVVAAGNSAENTKTYGLASLPNVIAVGASDVNDKRAGFSNWGEAVDIVAPGVNVLSLRARRTDVSLVSGQKNYKPGADFVGPEAKYYHATGTSFAAPYVTGVASLLFAHNPQLTPDQVKRMILQSARDIDVPGIDQFTGYGLVDAHAALQADPEFFIQCHISGVKVVREHGKLYVQVHGDVGADKLGKAWIELGKGEEPSKWKKISDNMTKPVQHGAITNLEVKHFKGGKQWTLRLIVEHKNGKRREQHFLLNLG